MYRLWNQMTSVRAPGAAVSDKPREALRPSCPGLRAQRRAAAFLTPPTSAVVAWPVLWGLGHTGPGFEPSHTGLRWVWCGHSRSPGQGLCWPLAWHRASPSLPQSCKFNAGSQVPASGKETPPPGSASTIVVRTLFPPTDTSSHSGSTAQPAAAPLILV